MGVMLVGTCLDVLLSNVKAETLADVVVLDQSGHVVAATLAASRLATQRNLWLALFVAGTLAIMVVGYSLAQSIVQPVLRLRRVAQAAEQGDLSQRTGMPARDELGEIGMALDDLLERLGGAEADRQRLRAELDGERQALTDSRNGLEPVLKLLS